MRPCGPGPAPPAPPAAGLSRCHVRPQRRGAGPGARPAGGAERAERSCRLSSSAARGALQPPRRRRRRLSLPQAGCCPRSPSAVQRSLGLRLLPAPGAARAVQVIALSRKLEAERRAPGFPRPLPAPSAARAGPRARDAPPRGTVPTAGRPFAASAGRNGSPPFTWVPDPGWGPGRREPAPFCLGFPALRAVSTPSGRALGTGSFRAGKDGKQVELPDIFAKPVLGAQAQIQEDFVGKAATLWPDSKHVPGLGGWGLGNSPGSPLTFSSPRSRPCEYPALSSWAELVVLSPAFTVWAITSVPASSLLCPTDGLSELLTVPGTTLFSVTANVNEWLNGQPDSMLLRLSLSEKP
ncbi:unnamed protein product [Rangifer tarandus platyrhynchus]|uniref:Uncharacterized protein n=1 Tax=Rangifer tarandus platyrhynchus TaxID=3082113 RepID=A0AC59ZKQ2_RANTA